MKEFFLEFYFFIIVSLMSLLGGIYNKTYGVKSEANFPNRTKLQNHLPEIYRLNRQQTNFRKSNTFVPKELCNQKHNCACCCPKKPFSVWLQNTM
jgi:hypothetical protein